MADQSVACVLGGTNVRGRREGVGNGARIVWVHNFATHYTAPVFELVAQRLPTEFLFFSRGEERYWLKQHGTWGGSFPHYYLPGFSVLRTKVVPSLLWRLLVGRYSAFVKCVNGKFALPVTYLAARLRRKPFVLYTGIWTRLKTPVHRLGFPFIRHIYRHADALVVYGEHVKRYLESEGVCPDRIFVAPHAVDNRFYGRPVAEAEKEQLRVQLGITRDSKIVLYLGRFEEIKGLNYLVEAFLSLETRDAVLVLAGDGSERGSLERRLKGCERARIVGYVQRESVPVYNAAAWVSVLPSVTLKEGKEPWGLTVNEAFCQGTPVIVTDAVGAAAGGLVQHGVNGLVIAERSSDQLAWALNRVLTVPGLRDRMGQAARETIGHWTQERMAEGFCQAIEYVLRNRVARRR